MALNRRERTLLIVTASVLVVGANYFLLLPLKRTWSATGRDLATARRELDAVHATLERAPQWTVEYGQLRASLGERSEKFTTSADVLRRIEEVSKTAGVVISSRRPLRDEDRGVYRELPVSCTIEATTESLVRFLYALQTGSGFMNVEQLQVTGRADNPAVLRCDIQIRALTGKTGGPAS